MKCDGGSNKEQYGIQEGCSSLIEIINQSDMPADIACIFYLVYQVNLPSMDVPDNATMLQDLIEYSGMNFSDGNIFKGCYRFGNCEHSSKERDMNKIKWFLEREKANSQHSATKRELRTYDLMLMIINKKIKDYNQ